MATQKIALDIAINTLDASSSLKELKQNISGLTNALVGIEKGTEEYNRLSTAIQSAQKKIRDMNDDIARTSAVGKIEAIANVGTQIAAGFSLAQGAMALFGTESKEVEKALLKVQAAQAILQGVKELEGMADAWKNMSSVVQGFGKSAIAAFQGMKGAIMATGIGVLLVALGTVVAYWDDIKRAVSGVDRAQENLLEAEKKLVAEAEKKLNHIVKEENILKLQGKTEKEILEIKKGATKEAIRGLEAQLITQEQMKKAQIETATRNRDILSGILKFVEAPITSITYLIDNIGKAFGKEWNLTQKFTDTVAELLFDPKEVEEKADAAIEETKAKLEELKNAEAGYQLTIAEINKKAYEEKLKRDEEYWKKRADLFKEQFEKEQQQIKNEEQIIDELKSNDEERLAEKKRQADIEAEIERQKQDAIINASLAGYEQEKEAQEKRKKHRQDIGNAIIGIEQQVFSIADSITKLATNNIEKQKKAEKIFAVSKLAIDTAKAISGAVAQAQSVPFPGNLAAIATGVATVLANMAQAKAILSRVDGGGDTGGGGFSGGGFSGNGATFTPSLNNSVGNTSTILSNLNNPTNQNTPPVKVYVTETDISNSINQVNKIKTKALIE